MPLSASHSDELRCPKCDQPLRRLTGSQGSFILTCPNRVKIGALKGGDVRSDHCGQKLHVLAAEGVAIVLPLSTEMFRKYQKAYPGAAKLYEDLGVIPTRPGTDYVPSFACVSCESPTKLYDLHGGYCRQCEPSE